jgi:uncharacterized surface protein with fasciclin (FAS1) repeats
MFRKLIAGVALAAVATTAVVPAIAAGPNLVDRAVQVNKATGLFDTLLAAATCDEQAGVLAALTAKGQKTLFAPTDDAFGALNLDEGNICTIDQAALTDILLYHVTPGRRPAGWIKNQAALPMANGDKAAVVAVNRSISVDGATIIVRNVPASNGFIHAVDAVLIPPTE